MAKKLFKLKDYLSINLKYNTEENIERGEYIVSSEFLEGVKYYEIKEYGTISLNLGNYTIGGSLSPSPIIIDELPNNIVLANGDLRLTRDKFLKIEIMLGSLGRYVLQCPYLYTENIGDGIDNYSVELMSRFPIVGFYKILNPATYALVRVVYNISDLGRDRYGVQILRILEEGEEIVPTINVNSDNTYDYLSLPEDYVEDETLKGTYLWLQFTPLDDGEPLKVGDIVQAFGINISQLRYDIAVPFSDFFVTRFGINLMKRVKKVIIDKYPVYGAKIAEELEEVYGDYYLYADTANLLKSANNFIREVKSLCIQYPKLEAAQKFFEESKVSGMLNDITGRKIGVRNRSRNFAEGSTTDESTTTGGQSVTFDIINTQYAGAANTNNNTATTTGGGTSFNHSDSTIDGATEESVTHQRDRDTLFAEIAQSAFDAQSPCGQFLRAFAASLLIAPEEDI